MSLTPRKTEVDAVVAILESEEHEDPASMAKAIVKAVAEELSKRDAYGVAIGLPTDDLRVPHGPFFTAADAARVVKEASARGLVAFSAPLFAADRALSTEEAARSSRCATCKHPVELHGERMTTFSGKPKPMSSLGCAVYHRETKEKCPCQGFTK